MKIKICDKCGVTGRRSKAAAGPNVAEVHAGRHHGGRVLDLCGDCRVLFTGLLNEWLALAAPSVPPAVWIDPQCGCERSPDVTKGTPCPRHSDPSVPPDRPGEGCSTVSWSSRVCERGTKCCVVEHGKATEGVATGSVEAERDRARWLVRHLFAMIPDATWSEHGAGVIEGHDEGLYRASLLEEEIRSWAAQIEGHRPMLWRKSLRATEEGA